MSEPIKKILFLSDSHIDYMARCRVHTNSGLNMRVRDGLIAFRSTIDLAFEHQVDAVVHGGDLFHKSVPTVGGLVWVRGQLNRLIKAGIPFYGNTGNHDATNERGKEAATAAVHDPDRGVQIVTDPYKVVHLDDGLALHVVSHYGLAQAERLMPEPVDGAVNLLTAHGAAIVPGNAALFKCADSPGEQPLGLDLLIDDRFVVKMLGHYHGMGEIMPGVFYAGSSIRRGFSDPPGGRGAYLFNVYGDGRVEAEPLYINQRPQFDLPVIDAAGMTGAQVEEAIRHNIEQVDVNGAIIRQVVNNCTTAVRRGIDQPALSRLMHPALMWMPEFRRPEATNDQGERTVEGVSSSLTTAGSADLPGMYRGWVDEWAETAQVAEEIRPVVVAEGERHLRAVSVDAEAGDFAVPADDNAALPAQRVEARPAAAAAVASPAASRVDSVTDEEAPF